MAAGTVGYSDTRGNKDYTSIIAGQIGRRLKEASNMAGEERAFAAKQAEAGGTSLEEAGVGKGYFFGKALGSRFGGDRIARTKGRMGMGGAGNNPANNYKQRFRGGFDYNVTNQNITDVAPLSNALVVGLSGVEQGLSDVAGAIQRQGTILNQLSQSQADMAKATMFNGYLFAMFQNQQKQKKGRDSLRREEKSIEGGGFGGGRRRGFGGFGGRGRGRGMINVTPKGAASKGAPVIAGVGNALKTADTAQTGVKLLAETTRGGANLAKGAYRGISAASRSLADQGIRGPSKILKAVDKGIRPYLRKGSVAITGNVLADPVIDMIEEIIPAGSKGAKAIFSGDNLIGAQLSMLDDAAIAGKLGNLGKNLSPSAQTLLDDMMYGSLGAKNIKAKEAAELFQYIKAGNMTDGPLFTNEVLDLMEDALGPDQWKALTKNPGAALKNADAPIGKLLGNTVAEQTSKGLLKTAGKTASKGLGASLLKKIPLIAGLAGIGFGIQRAFKGDLMGAGLEIASGIMGATGVGTGLSFGIDGFLLARDLGMMPMAKGGIVKGMRGRGLPMMLGGTRALVGEGGSDEAVLPLNKKTFTSFGMGVMDAMQLKKSDFVKNLGMGVFSGIGSAKSGGLFEGVVGGVGDTISNVKDSVSNVLQKINPANLFKPNANGQNFFQRMGSGVTNWWNSGMKPNEGKMSWKDLISDDWSQRQRTQGAGKGSWNPLRGMPGYGTIKNFLTGNPGNEIAGGFQTGPTPLIRQSALRGAGLLMNPKAAIMAALMKPTALADGTMDGYLNSIGQNNDSNNLATPLGLAGQYITPTIINNNYYNNSAGKTEEGSEDATIGMGDLGMDAFMVNYSLMTK